MSLNNIWASKIKAWRGNCLTGQLTKEGAAMTYELGKSLREIYVNQNKFLPETLDPSKMYFRATGFQELNNLFSPFFRAFIHHQQDQRAFLCHSTLLQMITKP